jgi:hypothetical protein
MMSIKDYILTTEYQPLNREIKKNRELYDYVRRQTSFLEEGVSNTQRFYHIKSGLVEIPKCPQCGEDTTFSKKAGANKGYNKYCGRSCRTRFINLNRSEEETKLRKEKIKQTCLERYGAEHYFSAPEVREKVTNSFLNRYGVDNPSKLDSIKAKKEETCLKNHGVKNPSQDSKIHSKKSKTARNKLLITETGKTFHFEGYEDRAIRTLLEDHHEHDILVHSEIEEEIGKIRYTLNDRQHVYHPDIYIKSQHKIVEVKSTYWYKKHLQRNLKKKEACIRDGLAFEFWIYTECSNIPRIK